MLLLIGRKNVYALYCVLFFFFNIFFLNVSGWRLYFYLFWPCRGNSETLASLPGIEPVPPVSLSHVLASTTQEGAPPEVSLLPQHLRRETERLVPLPGLDPNLDQCLTNGQGYGAFKVVNSSLTAWVKCSGPSCLG